MRAVQTIRPHTINEHIPIHNMHPMQSARAGLVHLKHNAQCMAKDSGMMNCLQWISQSVLQARIVHETKHES